MQLGAQVQETTKTAVSVDRVMTESNNISSYSRSEFIRLCARSAGAFALFCSAPKSGLAQTTPPKEPAKATAVDSFTCDLRGFVRWILDDFEPSVRLPGGAGRYAGRPGQTAPALFGVADMAYVLYTIGALHPSAAERAEWGSAFELFQNHHTGWFLARDSGLPLQQNTAFALGAMQLLDLTPRYRVKMGKQYADIRAYLNSLNWRTGVYGSSQSGAGIARIRTLVPALRSPSWFAEYFSTCDSFFDPSNGLMGKDKPPGGDIDQVGGTFHYSFLYEYFNRQMPYPEERIDTVLRLQRPNGYWSPTNPLWMTLDAMYLMTCSLRYCPHRFEDVRSSVHKIMNVLQKDVFSPEGRKNIFARGEAVHSLTAAICIAADAQEFLGAREVITDWPLKLVLDRGPW